MRFAVLLLTATLAIAGEFSTAIGDAYLYIVSAVTTDAAGNTYVTGSRNLGGPAVIYSGLVSDPPPGSVTLTANYQPAGSDVFVTKLDPNGNLLFTDTFAGKGTDEGSAIAVDSFGNIYVGGVTTSSDFPVSKALQTQSNPTYGTGFIIKLSPEGSTILYSTYFGGTLGGSSISSLATDSNGNLFVTGFTGSADFPHTTGFPFSTPVGPNSGAILACISPAGDKLLFSGALIGGPQIGALPSPVLTYSSFTVPGASQSVWVTP